MEPDRPIGDYAVIGDCRSAALVSRDGSLDWLCWPRFDSPSVFAALLDANRGGRFRIRPTGAFRTERRYLPGTNVLETVFLTPTGRAALRDLMPVASEEAKRSALVPEHEVLRELEGVDGEVELTIEYAPRPGYARDDARLERRGEIGLVCAAGSGLLLLRSDVPLAVSADRRTAGAVARVGAGERLFLSLGYALDGPAVIPPLGQAAQERLERSVRWWRAWSARCAYRGPYRDAVVRSALALKLMSYAPSGAIVAAPTTSLPERVGGVRNWDYRYCWLRDASLTLRALLGLGYREEADAFFDWILHATRLTQPELQVVYTVFGEARIPETVLGHLSGHAGSRPVRIGNGAARQVQLDVYGEVLDAAVRYARAGGRFDRDGRRMLAGLGRTVLEQWREPDDGIWEARSGPRHHTHSKALCWVALDRLIELRDRWGVDVDVDSGRVRAAQERIRAEVETRGYDEETRSYVRTFDDDALDAALLTLPLYGYVDAAHPRMAATRARITEQLGPAPLVRRYAERTDDGLAEGEGAFGICGFWAVECRALAGDVTGAARWLEQLLGYANDVGLFAEEIDPETGAALGNVPQAFTHVGLVNAALTLAERLGPSDDAIRASGSSRTPAEVSR